MKLLPHLRVQQMIHLLKSTELMSRSSRSFLTQKGDCSFLKCQTRWNAYPCLQSPPTSSHWPPVWLWLTPLPLWVSWRAAYSRSPSWPSWSLALTWLSNQVWLCLELNYLKRKNWEMMLPRKRREKKTRMRGQAMKKLKQKINMLKKYSLKI